MGALTPIGLDVPSYWKALTAGVCGVGPITRFDASSTRYLRVAELKGFDPIDYMPKTLARTMDPFMQYAFAAAEQALMDSGLDVAAAPDRIGIVMGTAMDGVTTVAGTQASYDAGHRVGPRFVPMTIGNIAAAQISIMHGITGPSLTLNTACSAGGDAVMTAAMLLRAGEADAILAVGGESILCPVVVSGLARRMRSHAVTTTRRTPAAPLTPSATDLSSARAAAHSSSRPRRTPAHATRISMPSLPAMPTPRTPTTSPRPIPRAPGAAACMRRALARAGMERAISTISTRTAPRPAWVTSPRRWRSRRSLADARAPRHLFDQVYDRPSHGRRRADRGHRLHHGHP